MISTLVDRTLQLFGRDFLVAAFVPVLIAMAALGALVLGLEPVAATVRRWATDGLATAAFEVSAWLVGAYLLAYLLYGVRHVLRDLYAGLWPAPARPLQRVAERLATWWYRRRRERLRTLTDRKNDTGWVLSTPPRQWTQLYHARPLTGSALDGRLSAAQRSLRSVEARLARGRRVPRRRALAGLRAGRQVLASWESATPAQRARIGDLRGRYERLRGERPFVRAAQSLDAWVERCRADREVAFEADYPSGEPTGEARVRATALGNVTARLHTYSEARYGIPLDVLWPRLVHVLPDHGRLRVDDAVALLDLAVISATLALAGLGVSVGLAVTGGEVARSGAGVVVSLAAFVLFLRVAVAAARVFADETQACVDLHRRALLQALGFAVPDELGEERAVWQGVHLFLSRAEVPEATTPERGPCPPAAKATSWWRVRRGGTS